MSTLNKGEDFLKTFTEREKRQREKGNRTESKTRTKGSELGSVASGDAALFS